MSLFTIEVTELAADAHQLDRIEHLLKRTIHNQGAIYMDLTAIKTSVTNLEAQQAVDHQLIADLLTALKASQDGGVTQADIDALQARVDAVGAAIKTDDDAGRAAL